MIRLVPEFGFSRAFARAARLRRRSVESFWSAVHLANGEGVCCAHSGVAPRSDGSHLLALPGRNPR